MRQNGGGRLSALRTPLGVTALLLSGLLAALAILAPIVLHGRTASIDVSAMQQGSSAKHWLGTDALGRDVLVRVLVATRLSIELAIIATTLGTVIGTILGGLPSVLGGRVGKIVGRLLVDLINLLVAFPGLLLALFLAVVFGVGQWGAVLALSVAIAPGFARLTFTLASSVSAADYVSAARLLGVRRLRLLRKHILPNIAEPLVVNATMTVGGVLLAFAGLSFLGFGVQAPSYDWGRMLNEGLLRIYLNPAAAIAPGVAVVIAGITFNLLGDLVAQMVSGRSQSRKSRGMIGRQRAQDRALSTEVIADAQGDGSARVVRISNLRVAFPGEDSLIEPVRGIEIEIRPAEIVGLVGESGSGKSLTASAIADLVPYPGLVTASDFQLMGSDLVSLAKGARNHLLGTSVATIFQDPMSSLNPALRIGRQMTEVVEKHQGMKHRPAIRLAIDRLRAVRIPAPERRIKQYPHEFSGGMRQRAVIAMGLMAEPSLIIADEPTTALDVTVQHEILALLRQARDSRQTAILLITHDIGVVAETASRVLVMYAGRIVESLPVAALADDAAHPYTRALVNSVPDMDTERDKPLQTIEGRPPEPADRTQGCAFAPRCALASEKCHTQEPPVVHLGPSRFAECWHPHPVSIGTSEELAQAASLGSGG